MGQAVGLIHSRSSGFIPPRPSHSHSQHIQFQARAVGYATGYGGFGERLGFYHSKSRRTARVYLVMYLQDRLRSFARPPRSSPITSRSIKDTIGAFIEDLQWSDYKPDITNSYINHSVDRHYKSPSCRTLYEKGYCIGRCPFYDRSGGV